MTKLRQLWLLTALGSLAVLAGGWFLLVSPKANKAAALREEADIQLQANRGLQSQIDQLNKQKKELPKLQGDLNEFRTKVPSNPALPALIRSLADAAELAGVALHSVKPSAPTLTPATTAAGVTTATAASGGTVAGPGGTVLADIKVDIEVYGTYSQISQFFNELESLERAMLVPGFTVGGLKGGTAARRVPPGGLWANISTVVVMTTKAPAAATPVAPVTTETAS
jgi:Tfp pilus assembly protein PilO